MTADQFCYWLQGFFEVSGQTTLTEPQVSVIKEHLQLVFKKETTATVSSNPFWPYGQKPLTFNAANPNIEIPVSC